MTPPLLVTDTHPLVWHLTAQVRKLPAVVKQAFDDAVEGRAAILIPAVVLWELSLIMRAGMLNTPVPLDECVRQHFFAKGISIVDIETEDILRAHTLTFSRDLFDTLIVAMTLRVDCPLITADGVIHNKKPCELFWD
jgi:PIN domain nuclease of toxin-antitoxin system